MIKIFVFLFAQLSIQVFAQSPYSPTLDYRELKELIVSQNITTVDALIPKLPDILKRNSVLVYDSHALNLPRVGFETPRVILFNEDGTLAIAFTKHPGESEVSRGLDTLEVISFNKKTALYEVRDLVLNGKENPYAKGEPEVNPALCLKCHGSNPRPIFQDYNSWAGVYGSFSQKGIAARDSKEAVGLKAFLEKASKMPRYKDLDLSQITPTELGYEVKSKDYLFTPALVFGQNIQRNMEVRLAKKIIGHPKLAQNRSLLAYLGSDLNTCGSVRERVKEVFKRMILSSGQTTKAEALLKNIEAQIREDYAFKTAGFRQFNVALEAADPRGVISIPYSNLYIETDPFYGKDKPSWQNQLVLIQAFAEVFDLKMEDISSFPLAPSLGIAHILRLGLYKDEQIFLGLTEAMMALDQFSVPRIENSCERTKTAALKQVENWKFGTVPTVFQPAKNSVQ